MTNDLRIRNATIEDVPLILEFIRELATYERLAHEVVATEEILRETIFGEPRRVEVLLAYDGDDSVGFALFFQNFSTFLGRPGIYLEDLFVRPQARGRGFGKALLARLAQIARDRNCGRFEWAVLDWNEPSIKFYESLGANAIDEWRIFRMTGDALTKLAASADE